MYTPASISDEARTDRDLVAQFAQSRDEGAFCDLLARHGPGVWRVCRRLLPVRQDAEDAFQATFLVLARSAGRIRRRGSVGSWLYGVAYRTSVRVRKQQRRRAECPLDGAGDPVDPSLPEVVDFHQRAMLDAELARLPRRYREPVMLHYFAGQSRSEIAQTLGVSPTVVKGRLQRGRDRLRMRLAMRGVWLSVALAASDRLASEAWASTRTSQLAGQILQAGLRSAPGGNGPAGLSKTVFHLAAKELSTMATSLPATIVVGAILAATLGLSGQPAGSAQSASQAPPPAVATVAELGVATVEDELAERVSAVPAIDAASLPVVVTLTAQVEIKAAPKAGGGDGATLKYGDDAADGKKSIAGSGEMIQFTAPAAGAKLRGIRLHGARYGYPQPPKEDFTIYVIGEDGTKVLHNEAMPYARFERGDAKWVALEFKTPVEVPEKFWIAVEFKAERTKGVYVSYDTSTGGKHSRVGLPGSPSKETDFQGDWMIQALLAK